MDPREQINNIIILADQDLQANKFEDAMNKYQEAIAIAQKIDWQERILQINQLIADFKKKEEIKKQEADKRRLFEEEQKKKQDEERKLAEARQRMEQKKDLDRQQKMELLKKKKEQEDRLSNEAYDFLGKGSDALKNEKFEDALRFFEAAKENFNTIKWMTEVQRVQDVLKDAQEKFSIYQKKQQQELEKTKILAEKFQEHESQLQKEAQLKQKQQLDIQKKILSVENKNQLQKEMSEKAFALMDQGNTFANVNEYTKAIDVFREAKDIFEKIEYKNEADKALIQISNFRDRKLKYDALRMKQEENERKKREDQQELEHQAEIARRMQSIKEKEEKSKLNKNIQDKNYAQSVADECFAAIEKIEKEIRIYEDEVKAGRILQAISPYDKAIEVYEKSQIALRDIGWLEQSNRISDGARTYQEKLIRDKKLRDSELRKIESVKQSELDMKRQIDSSQRMAQLKEEERKRAVMGEQSKKQYQKEIQDECLVLLDKAKIFYDKKQFKDAIMVYEQVITKCRSIDWNEGIRITKETLVKAQAEFEQAERERLISLKSKEEQEKAQRELEEKIRLSQHEEEIRKLELDKKILEKKQMEGEKKQLQNDLLNYLEEASKYILKDQYDSALELQQKALDILKQIDWPGKFQQIQDEIKDTKNRKLQFLKKTQIIQEQQRKAEEQQQILQERLVKEEEERKKKNLEIRQMMLNQKQKTDLSKTLSETGYKELDIGENAVKADKLYLALNHFHEAFQNFTKIDWAREANTAKTRIGQIYEKLNPALIDLNEFITNQDPENEAIVCDALNQCTQARKVKQYENALFALRSAIMKIQALKWVKSFNLSSTFENHLQQEMSQYNTELQEMENRPTQENAMKLLDQAKINVQRLEFEIGINLAQHAADMFQKMGWERELGMVNGEIVRWKHQQEKFQEDLKAAEGQKIQSSTENLDEEAKKLALIEERKRLRREERKKNKEPENPE